MKKQIAIICIYDKVTHEVVDQVDRCVPDIFNTFDVCDICKEPSKCKNCIVKDLQMDQYFI